jgi:hypothetical protein
MAYKTYSIFGAGAAGLYTAWRLLEGTVKDPKFKSKQLTKGDTLELYDWGKYDFSKKHPGTREAGARICTWHYKNDPGNSYVELGGMRYSAWDMKSNDGLASGHRLVSTVIKKMNLDQYSIPFNVTNNQLFYLRTRNFYMNDISSNKPASYAADHFGASATPDQGFTTIENLAFTPDEAAKKTRSDWNEFYNKGRIKAELPDTSIFKKGDLLKDIGYWNLLYDQLGSEGYDYAADGNGYSSNVINSNSAVDINSNNEFAPGSQYKTLSIGYSGMFNALFDMIVKLCRDKGIHFKYRPNIRLHSILEKNKMVHFTFATRENPWTKAGAGIADAAWMAMGRSAIEQVAQATRYTEQDGLDVLNDKKVTLYLESTIMQPSYKVGMFFTDPWWSSQAKQPPPYPAQTSDNSIGPSATDTPIRMVVYFGNNALNKDQKNPIYGILASYDDEDNTTFWQELELGAKKERTSPISEDVQPLEGPRHVPSRMVKMLRKMLAEMHFGPNSNYSNVPEPIEAAYMDWSLPPFNAGYHQWAAHFDIGDVQRKIRKPSQLIKGKDANIFIVGEAYSNDQAWVEGAFCTAESVLNDFFGVTHIIDNSHYPFICEKKKSGK